MPDLGLPLLVSDFTPQIMVTLFIKANASNDELKLVRDSVATGRTILARYGIGLAVIPPAGISSREHIGTFTTTGPLFEETLDSYKRLLTRGPGGLTARTEVNGKMNAPGKTAIVLFGAATAVNSRGYTEFGSSFPYYCMVSLTSAAKTTMIHEVGHCADMQHYMAFRDLIDRSTMEEKNIMAEVPDAKADARSEFNQMELDLFKKSYFFGLLD